MTDRRPTGGESILVASRDRPRDAQPNLGNLGGGKWRKVGQKIGLAVWKRSLRKSRLRMGANWALQPVPLVARSPHHTGLSPLHAGAWSESGRGAVREAKWGKPFGEVYTFG